MIKHVVFLLFLFASCVSYACGDGHIYSPPVVHAMRVQTPTENPIAKHPIVPRRVASARRVIRY